MPSDLHIKIDNRETKFAMHYGCHPWKFMAAQSLMGGYVQISIHTQSSEESAQLRPPAALAVASCCSAASCWAHALVAEDWDEKNVDSEKTEMLNTSCWKMSDSEKTSDKAAALFCSAAQCYLFLWYDSVSSNLGSFIWFSATLSSSRNI
jgi:hypothetical protein